ncbi:CD209 antigen-like protein A isoform X2 [Mastacembelus armatus]|uniref:CD209 antigen-like protein A isoform X2 n=1 Tax=Mastacembelus armatus TaxID=205130 RepID=UPI000E459E87|nr:CD209 antigen-like protein A isoform X2 [Mastacembelus armatus]
MNYENAPSQSLASKGHRDEDGALTPATRGTKVFKIVAVSFGLLCILQAAVNISLRLAHYNSDNETAGTKYSCRNVTEEIDQMKQKLTNFEYYHQQGWLYFRSSFYYISSVSKSWYESRKYCLLKGADLVIINSKEEQDFTRTFQKVMWLGLTDRTKRRMWKWVDGTALTISYWHSGEPNNFEGKIEDCAEIRFYDVENSWNDIPCNDQNFWICEKTVTL